MTKKTTNDQPQPIPLFDTMEYLENPAECTLSFIKQIPIQETEKEFQLATEFLKSYSGSSDTFTAYRREIERLMFWSWLVAKKSLIALDRNDIRDYLLFVNKPPLNWVGNKTVARFKLQNQQRLPNPDWRPFVIRIPKVQKNKYTLINLEEHKLTNRSIQALFATLSTFFTFLQQEDYLEKNPVALVRQKSRFLQKTQNVKVTRKLSPKQWQHVISMAEQLAKQDVEHERTLFILSAFYLLGLRISEISETPGRIPSMSDFSPDKNGLWWFTTVGKGNKQRDVAVPDEMLAILKRYRISRMLSPLPQRGEDTSLLHNKRSHSGLGTRQVRHLVQSCFDLAVQSLINLGFQDEAEDLRSATVHWLRHTAITADVEFRPREHVRDDVGHENPATTERYIDVDRADRHHSAKHKTLHPFNDESLKEPYFSPKKNMVE